VAIHIRDIEVTSMATSTGSMAEREEAFNDDPFVDHRCPECGETWPDSVVEGTGEDAIKCAECGANASSFGFEYGYTVAFDHENAVGITLDKEGAHELATNAEEVMDIPENARQHPILLYEPDGIPGTVGRLRPFVGNIGTTPPVTMPDSHNAGDFGQSLIGADHDYGVETETDLEARTDGHMDIPEVRTGATLICPVVVDGGGIYVGDLHANQGDGELSLHTTDVSGTVTMDVEVIEGLELDGPVLLPNEQDLPFISQPYSDAEREAGTALGEEHGVDAETEMGPIQVVGSGATVNDATQNAFDRAATLLDMSEGEIRARCTFTGGVQVGRLPGVVQLDMLAPLDVLADRGLDDLVREQYGL
jgi:acetamidase/formamidase